MSNFVSAARAKKLDRVAAAYAVAAWLLVQGAAIALPSFAAPAWALRALIALALVGFPVALFVAWYSIPHPHPDEVKTHGGLASGEVALLALLGTVIVLSLAQFGYQFWYSGTQISPSASEARVAGGPPQASVAVLPFEDLSSDKEAAYFAAGIQDEILTRLTKIGELKVISRTSTARYASRPGNLPEIAKELGVANVLEGSVQKVGNAVHINVQLIKASTDDHVWAEIYDRKLDDVFGVEAEVATAIADSLNAKMTGGEKRAITARPTDNPAAYDAYLRGMALQKSLSYFSRFDPRVRVYFEEAVRLDPKFAVAWAMLAQINAAEYSSSADTGEARKEAARSALDNAFRLAPELAEVQLAKGYYQYRLEGNNEKAYRTFDALIRRWPNNSEILEALALVSRRLGDWAGSKSYFQRAISLDPLSSDLLVNFAQTLRFNREYQAALKAYDNALDKFPADVNLLYENALLYQSLGELNKASKLLAGIQGPLPDYRPIEAIANQSRLEHRYSDGIDRLQKLVGAPGDKSYASGILALNLGNLRRLAGDTIGAKVSYIEARDVLTSNLTNFWVSNIRGGYLAQAYCGLGDRNTAMKYAERAAEMLPMTKDQVDGVTVAFNLAKVEACFGDKDRAIPLVTKLLKSPGYLTPALLRLDPDFDKLRSDPRFEALAR